MATIRIEGGDIAFDCPADDSVMRAALRAGLGFPYECNTGSCGSCRFQLIDGEVAHQRSDPPAWSDRDRQRNRWLGCQARPLTDCRIKVRLDRRYESAHRPRRRPARLIGAEPVTHDMAEFRFAVADADGFRPGQYALFELPGVDGARAYSMCNTPDQSGEWHFHIKRVPGGAATTALFVGLFGGLAAGGEIAMDGPYGLAWLREDAPRDILCLAGGSGLSPMVSIARAAVACEALAGRSIDFLYGGRTPSDVCGESMLAALPGFGERLRYHAAISEPSAEAGWSGPTGFVHDVAGALFGDRLGGQEIYFAGPPAMAQAVRQMLHEAKVPPEQIHYDEFY